MASNKDSMIKKLGSEAAYKAWTAANGAKQHNRSGGFKNKELARQAGIKSGIARRKNKEL